VSKGKFICHKGKVIMVWRGDRHGLGKRIKVNTNACLYSSLNHKKLVDKGVKFVNRFVDAYPFPGHYTKPRDCQVEMLDFSLRHHRYYNLSEMRTGKTAPVPWRVDIDIKYNGKKRFLVLAPLSTLEDTWRSEFFGIMPSTKVFYSVQGGTSSLKKALKRGKHQVFVINFDKLWRCIDELIEWDPEMVYIDEASDFNDPNTRKYKALEALMKQPKRGLAALTGTPTPNRPTDVWAIARMINPDTPRHWGQLRDKTMIKHPYKQHKWDERPEAREIVGNLMQPSIRFRTDDVNDMPSHEGMSVHIPMSTKQQQMYEEMKSQMITEDRGKIITAQHAGARLWKLLQIASGVCKDQEGNPVMIGAKPKIEEVKRLIRETPRKTVIMAPFTSVQHYIIKELRGQYRVGHINGGVPTKKRKKLIDDFQNDRLDVMVMHPKPTKYGLKLHAASQMIWFGPVYSALDFEQGSARIRGPGSGKTVYVKLSSTELEQEIFELIEQRMANQQGSMSVAQGITQLYETLFTGK